MGHMGKIPGEIPCGVSPDDTQRINADCLAVVLYWGGTRRVSSVDGSKCKNVREIGECSQGHNNIVSVEAVTVAADLNG